jgi:hypothetical protein
VVVERAPWPQPKDQVFIAPPRRADYRLMIEKLEIGSPNF